MCNCMGPCGSVAGGTANLIFILKLPALRYKPYKFIYKEKIFNLLIKTAKYKVCDKYLCILS